MAAPVKKTGSKKSKKNVPNGVPFRAPLNPLAPAEDQEITWPDVSVIETIVLLNVLWICTTPFGTLRLDFFEPVFFTVAGMMF